MRRERPPVNVATALSPALAMAAEAERGALVVSLHDVAPSTRPATEEILAELQRCGVRHCSLLVVPDYHKKGRVVDDRATCDWLRNLEAQGHEIVIHGYYHLRARQPVESGRTKLLTRLYTADEGEFYDIEFEQALRLIGRAREEFDTAGLHPRGFIAPAWLLCAAGERAVLEAGLEYTTRLRSVLDLATGRRTTAQSLVYSVRNGWRRQVSLLWNASLAKRQTHAGLVRLSIHPPDLQHAAIWKQIVGLAEEFARERQPMTYADWVQRDRLASASD